MTILKFSSSCKILWFYLNQSKSKSFKAMVQSLKTNNSWKLFPYINLMRGGEVEIFFEAKVVSLVQKSCRNLRKDSTYISSCPLDFFSFWFGDLVDGFPSSYLIFQNKSKLYNYTPGYYQHINNNNLIPTTPWFFICTLDRDENKLPVFHAYFSFSESQKSLYIHSKDLKLLLLL